MVGMIPIPDAAGIYWENEPEVVDIINAKTALKKTNENILKEYKDTIKDIEDLILKAVAARMFSVTYDASHLKMTYNEFHAITNYLRHFFGYNVWEVNGEIWEISWNKDD